MHESQPDAGLEGPLHDLTATSAHLRDLAALLALPRIWRDRDADFIAGSLLDVIVSLLRSDVASIHLVCGKDGLTIEDARPAGAFPTEALVGAAGTSRESSGREAFVVENPIGAGELRVLRVPSQLAEQRAVVLVGSRRADFPSAMESFLCRVAVEQAMIALHSSQLVTRLTAANAAKATFLATMSHELRTPLNAVVGYSELMKAEIGGPLSTQQHDYVRRVDAAARHLLGLIEGILSFARIEAGKETVSLADADAAQLAEGVMRLIEPLARAKGLAIDLARPDPPLPIHTDPAKVRQILLNLLSNAVKFTPHGRIAFDVVRDGEDVMWVVKDPGVGIDPGELERIFEPFHQVGERTSARAPGTGLGLSVSRQLARLLGGDVTAQSTPGIGSTFSVRLPVRAAARAATS